MQSKYLKRIHNISGYSLPELLIVLGLIGIIFGVLSYLFIPGIEMFQCGEKNIDSQQNAFKVINSFQTDLRESSPFSLVFKKTDGSYEYAATFPNPGEISIEAVSFISALNDNGRFCYLSYSGTPEWQKFVIYYLVKQDVCNFVTRYKLYRKYFKEDTYYLPSLAPLMIRSDDLNAVISDTDSAKLIASNIRSLRFNNLSNNRIGISVNTYFLISRGRVEESILSTIILLRN